MNYLSAAYTDVGISKETNQDSLLIQKAETAFGTVLLAVLCDGMGGLSKGEVASASVIGAFSRWFHQELPDLLYSGFRAERLHDSWEALIQKQCSLISDYGERIGIRIGTTCVAMLMLDNSYYIVNIGDSRIYLISDNVFQLTKDQTFVQREIDAGRMTFEESLVHSQRSVLLQCIGASDVVVPDYFVGEVRPGQCYLLCCDGFRHVIEPGEFFEQLNPEAMTDEQTIREHLAFLTRLNMERRESDNITAALIRTY